MLSVRKLGLFEGIVSPFAKRNLLFLEKVTFVKKVLGAPPEAPFRGGKKLGIFCCKWLLAHSQKCAYVENFKKCCCIVW